MLLAWIIYHVMVSAYHVDEVLSFLVSLAIGILIYVLGARRNSEEPSH